MDASILESGKNHLLQIGVSSKLKQRMANSVDTDETAHNEPSHQDLLFAKYLFRSAGLIIWFAHIIKIRITLKTYLFMWIKYFNWL